MININCCHLALVLTIANIVTLAIFAGYTVKLRERTLLLEKKNGKEQRQIDQLKAEIAKLKEQKPVKFRGFYSKSILKDNANETKDHDPTERNNHHDQR